MRDLFTDGANSFWHFFFGMMAVHCWPIIILFAFYQLKDPYETNMMIDFSEFYIGYLCYFLAQ